jgi:hypothetical protein
VSTATINDFDGVPGPRNQAHSMVTSPLDHRITLAGESWTTLDPSGVPVLAYARFDIDHPDYALSTTTAFPAPVAGSTSVPVVSRPSMASRHP